MFPAEKQAPFFNILSVDLYGDLKRSSSIAHLNALQTARLKAVKRMYLTIRKESSAMYYVLE